MAIPSNSSPDKKRNKKSNQSGKESMKRDMKKRNNCPGLRVLHGRIYDSEHGKTCHQCRQKTRDFAASCKNQKKDKLCTIKFCHKCLLNRYGEKAEEVELLNDWNCPKCRGICNCSFCMKKKGHKPTGILVHTAKATGFSSVSEMLNCKDPDNLGHEKDAGVSPKKPVSLKENAVISPRKRGKENSFDGNIDLKSHSGKKPKKIEEAGETEMPDENKNTAQLKKNSHGKHEISKKDSKKTVEHNRKESGTVISPSKMEKNTFDGNTGPKRHNEKKPTKIKQEGMKKEMPHKNNDTGSHLKNPSLKQNSEKTVEHNWKDNGEILGKKNIKVHYSKGANGIIKKDEDSTKGMQIDNVDSKFKQKVEACKMDKCTTELMDKDCDNDIPMPMGTDLKAVGGIELLPGDVGHAIQFLEFCSAFGKVFNMKKGQAESVLRELVCSRDSIYGRGARRAQYSSAIQFHIQLLTMILEEEESSSFSPTNGNNSWFQALGKYISESKCTLEDVPSDYFDKGNDGYNILDSSTKLRLLNFLCDETLDTAELRQWIDDQNSKFLETEKEAKEKVSVAKEKKKRLKQKLHDEIAKAVLAKSGASLSISEHEAIVVSVKREAEQALAELLEAMDMLPKTRQRADAIRTEPIFLDDNGHTYWRLNSYSGESDILLQEVGADAIAPGERWLTYDVEQKKAIEEYIAFRKKKRI